MRLIFVSIAFICSVACANGQQTYILTVGVDYKSQENGKRDQYSHDASDMKALFEEKSAYPVAAAYCVAGKKAELATLLDKLESIKKSATANDVVILFFSVHGGTGKKGNFSVDMTDKPLTGKMLAKAFDEIKGSVVLLMDTCEAGGMLSHPSTNPNVCVMLGCKANEETSGGKRNPLHGYYANAIYAALSGAGVRDKDGNLSLRELDRYLLDPRHVRDSEHQHAVSSLPKHMGGLKVFKR